MEAKNAKEERIRTIALAYYSRSDIKKALYEFSKQREVAPSYMMQGFGKRPDSFQYPSDITALVSKGVTSFHCSEELWKDPLSISTDMGEEQLNEIREGWDLLIDIDCKYLEYSKLAAKSLIKSLEFHGVKNIGVKFSGSKGFHIIVPWKAFPKEVYGQETKNMFPKFPRLVCQYLTEVARQILEKYMEEEDIKFTSKLDKVTVCKKCKKTSRELSRVNLFCPFCKREEHSEVVGEVKRKRCPECSSEMIEKDKKTFYRCDECGLNSLDNPNNFKSSIDIFKVLGVDVILVSSRHLFRMPYSVEFNEPILVKRNNKIASLKIGEFVDSFFEDKKELQVKNVSNLEYETLSLNIKRNKTRFNKIKKVIRHKIHEDLYSVQLESGRCVKVTSGHSLFVLRKGKIDLIKGSELKKKDYLVCLRKLNFPNSNLGSLYLPEEFIGVLDNEELRNVFIYNFDSLIFNEVYKTLSIQEKKQRKAYNWKVYNILPLDIYGILTKKDKGFKHNFVNSKIKFLKHGGASLGLTINLRVDRSLMRLLGYYVSEGNCDSRGRVVLSFGAHEKDLINDSIAILKHLGLNPCIEKPHKTAIQVVTQSTIFSLIIKSLFKCGSNAKEKRVPSIIWNVNEELKTEFLKSYIKGDGHLEKKWSKIIMSTVSKILKEDLCFLLSSLGIGYSLSERKITKFSKGKDKSYVVIIQGKEDVKKLGFNSFSKLSKESLVNRFPVKELDLESLILSSRWKHQYKQNNVLRRSAKFIKNLGPSNDVLRLIEGDSAFLEVKAIEKVKSNKDYVYDISVEKDENFVGGNSILLHNSLHEKTALASVVIDKDKILNFQVKDANPLKVTVRNFLPDAEEGEARELLIQAIDWSKDKEHELEKRKTEAKENGFKEIVITDLTPSLYPPCILEILEGLKQDGRKRALFILLNFFKSLKLSQPDIEKRIEEWNKKNYKPLKEGYVRSQLSWHERQKSVLPPNCDKSHYKDLSICKPDSLCRFVKNPVNYTVKKSFLTRKQEKKKAGKR